MNRLLLLEDDLSLIDGLTYSLRKNGFETEVVRTVRDCMSRLSKIDAYDLLILDVTLPDGTGFEVCEQVRKNGSRIGCGRGATSEERPCTMRPESRGCGWPPFCGR